MQMHFFENCSRFLFLILPTHHSAVHNFSGKKEEIKKIIPAATTAHQQQGDPQASRRKVPAPV